jgi:hypothetical protein
MQKLTGLKNVLWIIAIIFLVILIFVIFKINKDEITEKIPIIHPKEHPAPQKGPETLPQSFTRDYDLVKGITLMISVPKGYDPEIYGNRKIYFINTPGNQPQLAGRGQKYVDLGKNISMIEINYYNEEGPITVLFMKR